MKRIFGTDGVRGIPGEPPLTPELVRGLGRSAARVLLKRSSGAIRRALRRQRRSRGRRVRRCSAVDAAAPVILLGRDTRGSGPVLGRSLARGFAEAGCRTVDLGVVPTPVLSYLAPRRGALCGVVVSASHNPPEFNGIKFFTAAGFKLTPGIEREIERGLSSGPAGAPKSPAGLGERRTAAPGSARARKRSVPIEKDPGAVREYVDFLRSTFPPTRDLRGLRVVFDGSHGAAARIGPGLLRGLGAEVFPIGCSPDGGNINTGCGALLTGRMQREVVRRRAHCGIAMDGDADRALFADERGRMVDGDSLIALSALRMHGQGLLRGDRVVLTVMSNLGLVRFLKERGIGTVQVPVGDRNVTDALEAGGLVLGGENSGHIVFRRLSPTGDGLLTALQTLAAWLETGGRLSRVRSLYRRYPQLLRNVRVARRVPLEDLPAFTRAMRAAEKRMGDSGRIFVRYSGTEPLLRILVEGADRDLTRTISDRLVKAFQAEVSHAAGQAGS